MVPKVFDYESKTDFIPIIIVRDVPCVLGRAYANCVDGGRN